MIDSEPRTISAVGLTRIGHLPNIYQNLVPVIGYAPMNLPYERSRLLLHHTGLLTIPTFYTINIGLSNEIFNYFPPIDLPYFGCETPRGLHSCPNSLDTPR